MTTIKETIARFRQYIGRAIAMPVIALLVFAALLVWQILDLRSASRLVERSDQTIARANETLKLLVDEESGERGYLVTGNPLFLEPYLQARDKVDPSLDRLGDLVGAYPPQQAHIASLRSLYASWAGNALLEMDLYRKGPSSAFRSYFNQARGKQLMDAMRTQIAAIIDTAQQRRDLRRQQVERQTGSALAIILGGALVLGVALAMQSIKLLRTLSDEYEETLRSEQTTTQLLSMTLLSIGDAVLVTDAQTHITQMNAIAEQVTGWSTKEALGRPASEVFRIFNETTREIVESPIDRVIRDGAIVGLANHTVLIRRDGRDVPIDDSGAPIVDDTGRLIGTVLVFRDITDRRKLEQEHERMRNQAEQRAAEIAVAYEKEHRIAESLQRSLLEKPQIDAFANLEIETIYRAAWDEAQVGGDFYDIIALDGDRVGLVVGDVSGKGLNAAAKTAEVKYSLRAYLREYPFAEPGLVRLNEFIYQSQNLSAKPDTYFLCLSLTIVDVVTGDISICVAGQEPPLLIRPNEGVQGLEASGMPLGIISKADYRASSYTLMAGDILVIATDGITEARQSGGELLGQDGLREIVLTCGPNDSLQQIGETILNRASEHAGGTLQDDVCVVLVRRLANFLEAAPDGPFIRAGDD